MEKDPVCGMLVDPRQAAGQRQYQGKTYYLCSPACLERFNLAPQRYVPSGKPDHAPDRIRPPNRCDEEDSNHAG